MKSHAHRHTHHTNHIHKCLLNRYANFYINISDRQTHTFPTRWPILSHILRDPQTYTDKTQPTDTHKIQMYICIYANAYTHTSYILAHSQTDTLRDNRVTHTYTIKHRRSLAQKHIHQITHTSRRTGTNTQMSIHRYII